MEYKVIQLPQDPPDRGPRSERPNLNEASARVMALQDVGDFEAADREWNEFGRTVREWKRSVDTMDLATEMLNDYAEDGWVVASSSAGPSGVVVILQRD